MRLLLTLSLCLLAFVANADEADPPLPALYAVHDVAHDDVLNVRALPDAQAEIIGTLAHDAQGIEVTMLSRAGQWAQINITERTGWVAFRYLRREAIERDALGLPASLQCFGTEPFWDIRFANPEEIILRTPEGDARHALLISAPSAANVDLGAGGFRFEWQSQATVVTAHILPGHCSDGMSDRAYGLHYVDDLGPRIGCCSLN